MKNILKRVLWFLYYVFCMLFIGGLFIIWYDNEAGLMFNFLTTSFGLLGMAWLDSIFRDKVNM